MNVLDFLERFAVVPETHPLAHRGFIADLLDLPDQSVIKRGALDYDSFSLCSPDVLPHISLHSLSNPIVV